MSTDPIAEAAGAAPGGAGSGPQGQPSEEELRAAYEAELSRITSTDLMLQAAVSLLNVGSFRLAPRPSAGTPRAPGAGDPGAGQAPGAAAAAGEPQAPGAGDLEQARDAIDGARALLEILERSVPSEIAPLRNALSQLQMAYARTVQAAGAPPSSAPSTGEGAGGGGSAPSSGGGGGAPGSGEKPGEQRPPGPGPGPGPAESSGRLWVPGR